MTGWPALFSSAFKESRNGMLLADEGRSIVDANRALLMLFGARRDQVHEHAVGQGEVADRAAGAGIGHRDDDAGG